MKTLTDLRAYFQRGNSKPCSKELRTSGPGPELGWRCTLPKDHSGRHVAHDLDGSIITAWGAR